MNCFLADIYSEKNIIKDGVVPESFVFSSSGFLPECEGIHPVKGIHSHISGIDLVEGKDGEWYILEDNLRIPSGASYPLIARNICRRVSPETFSKNAIADNRDYAQMLKEMMDYVNTGGINVILTPGRYNAAFFEHSYLAEKTYNPESVIGVPGIMSVYKAGNVAMINAPGNGIADDKGIYYFVPKMIEYYLNEKPILKNAPTYLPYFEEDRKYVLEHLDKLVIKDVAEAGGYGVIFGKDLSPDELENIMTI